MVTLYHLVRQTICPTVADAWSGGGPYRFGARWSPVGVRVSYAAATRSLCALEVLAHIDRAMIPTDYVISAAELPEREIVYLRTAPAGWNAVMRNAATMAVGEAFVREQNAVALAVPSVVVPQEWNYLVNPRHPRIAQLIVRTEAEPFTFDQRLFS